MNITDKNKELNALISLLDEPDISIYDQVKDRIFSYGVEAIPFLENAWDRSYDNNLQSRIENIIHIIQQDKLYYDLNKWRHYNFNDLMAGFILVAKSQYPSLDEKTITDKVGQIIQDVWLEINDNLTHLEKIKVVNHILFEVHELSGNKVNIHDPLNSYINNIFETKRANPISLSIIYMVVCQSLRIPVYGVNLPQNFIMAYADRMISDISDKDSFSIEFYINAYNKGAVFTRHEIELFIKQINLEPDESFFQPCDNISIIRRVFGNLIHAYETSGDKAKALELKKLQSALD